MLCKLYESKGETQKFVFIKDGKDEPIRFFSCYWKRVCNRAGITKIPHDFRRTFAINAIRAGIPEVIIMRLCGWRTRSIFERYAIIAEQDKVSGVNKLQSYLASL